MNKEIFKRSQLLSSLKNLWVLMLVVSSSTFAEEVIPVGVEDGDIQVNKVIRTSPMGGNTIEYTKTRVPNLSSAVNSIKDINKHSSTLVQQVNQVTLTKKNTNVGQASQSLVGLHPVVPSNQNHFAALNLSSQESESNKLKRLVVRTQDDVVDEADRIKKIKAIQQKLKTQDGLKLSPGEELVKLKTQEKGKSTRSKRVQSSAENAVIDRLEFTRANILDVTRALADISGLNFVATDKAAKKNVTVFLQKISVIDALETITKNSGLWYRKDKKSGTYRIMSTDEYARDLVVYREDVTKVFRLLHPNPMLIARTIQDLYGERVVLSFGMFDETMMPQLSTGGGSSGLGRSNNSRGRGNGRGNNRGGGNGNGNRNGNQNVQTLNEAASIC